MTGMGSLESASLFGHRILFLSESISTEVANRLIAGLLLLDADDHETPIDLYINCPGGSVIDGLAVIDAIQCIRAPVYTICVGQAASMAACLLASGSPGHRYATPNAEVMLHQVAASFAGQATDIRIHTQRLVRLQERVIEMLAGWTGQPVDRIRCDMDRDCFLTAEEAKAYGLIDAVLETSSKRAH